MAALLLSLVTLQRLAELIHARRNTQRLITQGAIEIGADHYPLMVIIHGAWLVSLWMLLATGHAHLWWPATVAYLVVEVARVWVLVSLGRYWTTRIIVLPQAPLIRGGPYRFFRHPNYLVVALEVALLPLALGSWQLAVGFSLANAAILALRIRVEETGLEPRRHL